MTLPNADRAVIDDAKVRDYLLSLEHPIGRAKARFFSRLGFRRDRWGELRDALLALAQTGSAARIAVSVFGQKYVVRGSIQGPAGQAVVVTIWIVLRGENFPRFLTAYPGGAK